MNALRVPRTRLATRYGDTELFHKEYTNSFDSAVSQVTSPVTAPTLQLRALDVAVVVSLLVAVDLKSATRSVCTYDFEILTNTFRSAPRSDTLLVTALRLVATVAAASVATKEDMEAVAVSVDVKVDRPATLAVATDTCRGTVPRVKSVTTAEKLDI